MLVRLIDEEAIYPRTEKYDEYVEQHRQWTVI